MILQSASKRAESAWNKVLFERYGARVATVKFCWWFPLGYWRIWSLGHPIRHWRTHTQYFPRWALPWPRNIAPVWPFWIVQWLREAEMPCGFRCRRLRVQLALVIPDPSFKIIPLKAYPAWLPHKAAVFRTHRLILSGLRTFLRPYHMWSVYGQLTSFLVLFVRVVHSILFVQFDRILGKDHFAI